MFGRSRFTYFVSFLALLGPAVAANLYRMQFGTPEEADKARGLIAKNPAGTGSVIDHVLNTLGEDDPWVSTTSSKSFAQKSAQSPGESYVFYINPTGLEIVDTIKEFAKEGREHPHPGEKEFSVKRGVPWENIIKWDVFVRNELKETVTREEYETKKKGEKGPKRRTMPFIA